MALFILPTPCSRTLIGRLCCQIVDCVLTVRHYCEQCCIASDVRWISRVDTINPNTNTITMTYMVRVTVLSLLLGALALTAGLTLFFPPPGATAGLSPAITLNATSSKVTVGTGTFSNGELLLKLNTAGAGVVSLTDQPFDARSYAFLQLAIAEPSDTVQALISWTSNAKDNNVHAYVPHNTSWTGMWLATSEITDWADTIVTLNLILVGQPGETVRISTFGVFTSASSHQLQAIVSDLTGYVPWNRAAMNSHTGVTPVSSFYPTVLIVAYFTLSVLAYGLLLLVWRSTVQFSWRVIALIFLACWVSLDMLWQNRLLLQVADTYRTFADKNPQERIAAGPDAVLYNFVTQVIPLVRPPDARIFVSSSDIYLGQRGAYYLYPFNVFWPGPSGEFPAASLLHSGDLIVLIKPTPMRFDAATNTLATSPGTALGAELLFSDPTGQLLRVK